MIEILRRVVLGAGTLLGLWMVVQTPDFLYRIRPIDWVADRDRIRARDSSIKDTMSGVVPAEDLEGIDLASQTRGSLEQMIAAETEGRTIHVSSQKWQGLFNSVAETLAGNAPSPEWEARRGRFYTDESLFFRPDEGPVSDLAATFPTDAAFRYVEIQADGAIQHLGVTREGTGDLFGTAPPALLFPLRSAGLAVLAATLLLYASIPWPRLRRESMRYSRARSGVVPDLLAAFMVGFFFVLPIVVIKMNGFGAGPFSPGWVVLTLAMWLMGAIFAVIWPFAARYTATSAQWVDGQLVLRNVGGEHTVRPEEIERVQTRILDYTKFKKVLVGLSLFSWRAMGPALLASESEPVLVVALKDGRVFPFPETALIGAPQMVGRLRAAGVAIAPEVYEHLELTPQSSELDAAFPPLGKGVLAGSFAALAIVPLAALSVSTRPPAAPAFQDGTLPQAPYRSTKAKPWVPSAGLMQLERDTLAKMRALKARMDELEPLVRATTGSERAAALKEFNACLEQMRQLDAELEQARVKEGAPDE